MENLRAFVTRAIVCAFILLLFVDVVDDLCLANRWAGCPTELYPLIGAIIAAIAARQGAIAELKKLLEAEPAGEQKTTGG